MNLHEKKYKNYTLYVFEDKFFSVLEKILEKDYTIEKEFVNNDKSYVAKIRIDDKMYVLKKVIYRGKIRRKIRKYMTFFRKGDCLKALFAVKEMQEKNCEELADIYGAGIYKKGIIHDQFMLMECGIGRPIEPRKDCGIIENFLKKLHLAGRSHGDIHPRNFLMSTDSTLIAFDTKLKKIWPGKYQVHRDMRMFAESFGDIAKYPYTKNIFYYYFFKKELTQKLWAWLLQKHKNICS